MAQTKQGMHLVQTAASSAKTGVDVVIGLGKTGLGAGNDVVNTGVDIAQEIKDLGVQGMTVTGDKVGDLIKRLIDRVAGLA